MVAAWVELCRDLRDEQFIAACKVHLQESKFFPCPADILKAHEGAVPFYGQPVMALPEMTSSPDELHRSAVNAAMCILSLRNPEAKAFFALSDLSEKDAFARQMLGESYPKRREQHGRGGPVCMGNLLGDVRVQQ